MEKMMTIALLSNEFWGRRSGKLNKDGTKCFQQNQWGSGSNNQKGQGKRLRRLQRSMYGSKKGPTIK
jgi:hypothetical protein